MKKLTAGIFAAILTVVGTNAADAAIASKGYVDTEVGKVADVVTQNTASIGSINTKITDYDTVKSNAASALSASGTNTADIVKIKEEQTIQNADISALKTTAAGLGTLATKNTITSAEITDGTIVEDDLAEAVKTKLNTAGADISVLTTRVSAAEGDIDNLESGKADKATTLEGYGITDAATKTELTTLEGKVTKNAADIATKAATSVTDGLNTRLTTAEGEIDALQANKADTATIGTVAEGKTVVQMIEDAKTAATYDDTKVKAGIAANATGVTEAKAAAATADGKAVAAQNTANANATAITATQNALQQALLNPGECTNAGWKCALTIGEGGALSWEVIQRGTDDNMTSGGTANYAGVTYTSAQ